MTNLPDKVIQQRLKLQIGSLESPSELPGGFKSKMEDKKLLQQRFRLQLESLDSPSQLPGGLSDSVMSPMTDLAVNLCDTSLGSGLTPVQDSKRRLSMDSDSTPSPHLAGPLERSLSDSNTPLSSFACKPKQRLLLSSGRLTALKSLSSPKDLTNIRDTSNKENIPLGHHVILSPNKRSPYKFADSPLGLKPRKSPLDSKQFFPSPNKGVKVSPGKIAPLGRSLSVKRPMFTVLEDDDCNSRDSGYLSQPVEDERMARKKSRQELPSSMEDILSNCSPGKEEGVTPLVDSPKDKSPTKAANISQYSDGFDLESLSTISEEDDNESSKPGFTSLFSAPIILPQHIKDNSAFTAPAQSFPQSSRSEGIPNTSTARPMFRRALSMFTAPSPTCLDSDSPVSRNSLVELKPGFKRPDPPQAGGCMGKKRRVTPGGLMCERSTSLQENNSSSGVTRKKPAFVRSHSENELSIMKSCQLKEEVEDILPDSSRLYALPTFSAGSKHPSLRSISCNTLADLISGRHKDHVESFRIVDVRYKFEFDGGHIQGAENWQHGEDDQFLSAFLPSTPLPEAPKYCLENQSKRNILIFHCEFSSQRGPDFYMKLRERDRQLNKDVYPGLYYPECYLLHLGYKEFFKNYPELCTGSYTEMIDPRHESDLRKMRAKSKSWSGGTVARTGRMGRLHL